MNETLLVTDEEIIKRLGLPEKLGRDRLRALDDNKRSGFPPKLALWENRRWWPAVEAWFEAEYGRKIGNLHKGRAA